MAGPIRSLEDLARKGFDLNIKCPCGNFGGVTVRPKPVDYNGMRHLAEEAVKARLIDPGSAQISWPYGFADGYWKPALSKRIFGYYTCGFVNSKNRLGGYVGAVPFVVVVDKGSGAVSYLSIAQHDSWDLIVQAMTSACQRSPLPPPQPGMLDEPQSVSNTVDVADELSKLAALRDRGILSDAEFNAQKAKLLSR